MNRKQRGKANLTRLHKYLVTRWDAAPKAAPGLLMREQMGWPVASPQPDTSRSASFSFPHSQP